MNTLPASSVTARTEVGEQRRAGLPWTQGRCTAQLCRRLSYHCQCQRTCAVTAQTAARGSPARRTSEAFLPEDGVVGRTLNQELGPGFNV